MRLHRAFIFFMAGFLGGIIVLAGFLLAIQMQKKYSAIDAIQELASSATQDFVINPYSGLFSQNFETMTYDDTPFAGGYLSVSPRGRFIIFNTSKQSEPGTFLQRFYLADLMTGERKEISGTPLRDWDDDNVILTTLGNELQLFDTISPDSPLESWQFSSTIYSAKPSPQGDTLIVNTSDGVYTADRASGTKRKIIDGGQNGAYAWLQDNTRLVGFRQIPNTPGNNIPIHEPVIWNSQNGEYDVLAENFPTTTINYVEWIVPDQIARINTGWDDGSRDYVIDVPSQSYRYLGETSGDGSFNHQKNIKRLGLNVIEGNFDNFSWVIKNTTYWGDIEKKVTFRDTFRRYQSQLLDMDTAIYLRQQATSSYAETEVVRLDLNTGKETVLYKVDGWVRSLVVSTDGQDTYWIIPANDKLIIRSIESVDL